MENQKIILASKSPRRKQLLGEIIPNFEIKLREIEEVYPEDLASEKVPLYLAQLKASAFKDELKANEIYITSDTVVLQDNIIYGKPKDRADAIQILSALSNNNHEVLTGVCLLNKEKEVVFSVSTKVYFKALSLEEIEYYIDNFEPYDKAGAYAIQEWIGKIGVEKIEGDYNNIVGLPLFRLNEELKRF